MRRDSFSNPAPQVALVALLVAVITCGASGLLAQAPAPPTAPTAPVTAPQLAGADLTPIEHLNAARTAYDSGDWPQAEAFFDSFIKIYEGVPETAETARKAKPLLVTARLRQKKYAETLELLEAVMRDPLIDPVSADEMAFWRGICHLQLQDFEKAQTAFGEFYGGKLPYVVKLPDTHQPVHSGRRVETVLLYGACLLMKDDFAGTAKFFGEQIPNLQKLNREAAGRATVLRLHALLEAGDDAGALVLVRETFPRLNEITQVVAFQTLTLQLGSRFLDAERWYDAIFCLQRIWPREQLLLHQRKAQEQFVDRLEVVRRTPNQEYLAFQYEGLLTRIAREIEQFEKIENFDSALRLRLAMAYKELQRYREAALVLEDMLARMPEDPIVEKASLALIQCWMQVERWPKAVEAAEQYLAKFKRKDNPDVPMVHFLKASALHADKKPNEAELAFATVHQLHPDHELASRSLFMEGICLLEQELNLEAIDAFKETSKRYPDADVNEDCFYWIGMALSFEKRIAECRDHMESYLKRYNKNARYTPDATFRIAFSSFGIPEYPRAIKELRAFIAAYPGSQFAEEGKLLLGDALGAEGKVDEAVNVFRSVDRSLSSKFYEEAQFRIGNIFKLTEQPDDMRAHYEQFIKANPASQRIAEAVYWIGVTHDNAGRREDARKAYWDAITAHGDHIASRGVEDILLALPKVYGGEQGRSELLERLDQLIRQTTPAKANLSLRTQWAKAKLLEKKDPAAARTLLLAARPLLNIRQHSPVIIADIADALREMDQLAEAKTMYTDLRKWHPRALEKDRAYLGLGLVALKEHQQDEALKWLARFEKETLGSPLIAEVARIKADLFATNREYAEAQTEYERILDMPTVSRQIKAQTLLKLGDLMLAQRQDLKATAYYERVYISYGKYRPEVAAAYAKRAATLDRLNLKDKATEVRRELALREDLAETPEAKQAIATLTKADPDWRLREAKADAPATEPAAKSTPPQSGSKEAALKP
jgi:TolA-binding protein